MAEQISIIEKEYIIPLRKAFLKAPSYERTGKAIKAIKKFIARHMKIPERDVSKVKLDVFFNNDIWFRGRKHPPSKVKVKAKKENDFVKVDFVEIPQYVKFLKQKIEKSHKKAEKKEEKPKEKAKPEEKPAEKKEVKPEEKLSESKEEKKEDEEKKKDEKEKAQAVAELHAKEALQQAKVQKHLTAKKDPGFHRMALKK